MSQRSRSEFERAKRVIPGGVNSATRSVGSPWAFESARGGEMIDFDGRRFVDYHASFGATILGHGDKNVTRSVGEAMETLDLAGLGVTRLEIEYAELCRELIPSVEKSVQFMSGTEATFTAIRLARGATGRRHVIKFQGCYHGWHDSVARNVISASDVIGGLDPLSSGILPDALEATLIASFNDADSVRRLLEDYRGDVAAIIVEPIPHNVGALIPDEGFLEDLRRLADEHETVLIFDEVITGFRHAPGGYQELCGVRPDLTTWGKGQGNGVPVAGLGGRADLMDELSSAGGKVLLAGTFNGGGSSTAAAITVMKYLRDHREEHYDHVFSLGDRMRDGLTKIVDALGITAKVSGFGSVFVCYFMNRIPRSYADLLDNDDVAYTTFQRRMTERGFLMLPMSLKRNHIMGAHTEKQVDDTLETAHEVLSEMSQEGIV